MRIKMISGLAAATAGLLLAAGAALAQQPTTDWSPAAKNKLNEWTIGIAAGRTEGAPLRLTAELARALDDGNNLRLVPMVTRGPFDNMADLLMLRGVDGAILFGDTLDHFLNVDKVPRLLERVTYVANLFPSEVHVFGRPEINTLKDLEGKTVNFNSQGTAAAYTGPLIFKRLGINIKATFDPHPQAMAAMRQSGDKYAATFWVTTKPIEPLAKGDFPAGFKFISVPYAKELEDLYLPAVLNNADYPKLIATDKKVDTVAVPTVLAVYNWEPGSDRHRRLTRMVDYLVQRLPNLQKPPYDPVWKSVSLAAPVPGWRRFPHMEQKLEQLKRARNAGGEE
jgi:TRAP-type uncharacterized transport system substrate-binding protein